MKEDIYEVLKKLDIKYDEVRHKAVYTSDEARFIDDEIDGTGCKNLFLTDKKGRYFVAVIKDDQRADIKAVAKAAGVPHLTFADLDKLGEILGLGRGSVTPLGIVNDTDNLVTVAIEHSLQGRRLLFHPNTNTRTISIDFKDLIRFFEYEKHEYVIF